MPKLTQIQTQKMLQRLSPQQIQMIKLLELPTLQLEQRVKKELEENPVLEEDERSEENQEEEITVEDLYDEEDDTPAYKYRTRNYSPDDQTFTPFMVKGRSLIEFLEQQLGYRDISERERRIAKFIIGSIDDDGYLRRDMQSISDDIAFSVGLEVEQEELERLLKIIQQFDPPGVGARDLQECLVIQMGGKKLDTPARKLAYRVLSDYFVEFSKKHYKRLLQRLDVSEEELRDAIEEITSLSPKPGHTHNEGGTRAIPYIIPDFILDYSNGEFDLMLNSGNVPEVRVNRSYVNMVNDITSKKRKDRDKEDAETLQFVKSRVDSAKWFIQAIRQRQDTLMRTMTEILRYQSEYFVEGDITLLRPMILKDIADRTDLDVSTISRVVNSKYIQTHFGILLLKDLFSEGMMTESGEEVSSLEIKELMEECVDKEDKRRPLTDEALMRVLNDRGYKIARRTVAKYREMLGIPVARLRKEI